MKGLVRLLVALTFTATLAFASLGAQTRDSTSSNSLESLSLEELLSVEIVTATKTAVKLTDVPAASSVITRQDILRYGYRNLAEALARSPEAYTHFEGNNFGVDFRGFFANNVARRTLYLVNGHRVNDRFHFGDFYPDVIGDLQDVEQIEILRGPGAALYGSVAMLGVVNIITRDAKNQKEQTAWDMSATADEIGAGGLVTKYQLGVRHKFTDNVSVNASLYWFNGESVYDSRTAVSQRPWSSLETRNGAGIFNYAMRTDAYFDLPRSTNSGFSSQRFMGGVQLPGFNVRLNVGDFTFGSFLHTRLGSWIPPKDNATPNHPDNIRSWGTHAVFAEWKPKGALDNLDIMLRASYNVNTNREIADFSLTDSIRGANGIGTSSLNAGRIPGQFGNQNIFIRDNRTGRFIQYVNFIDRTLLTDDAARRNGGGSQFNYAGVDKSFGLEGQIAPVKTKELYVSLGGNYENADYENIQWFAHRNGNFIGWAPGGGIYDKGWYFGVWAQAIWTPFEALTVTAGARYDFQNVTDVGRQVGRDLRYDRIIRGADTSYLPFRVQNRIAQDFTPRIAVNYRLSKDANLRLIYAQAFRAVPPQEIIRLPRETNGDIPNAESEKLNNIDAIFSFKPTENLSFTLNGFYMDGNVVYSFAPATQSFNRGSGWTNIGGSVAANLVLPSGLEVWANATYYALGRSTDAFGFMRDWKDTTTTDGTPVAPFLPNQRLPIDSPTLLAKAGFSYLFPSQTSIAAELYYNGSIQILTPTNNNLGELTPVPNRGGVAGTTFDARNFVQYQIPSSFAMNLTLRQDLEPLGMKGFFILAKARNLLGTDVWGVLQMDAQGSWNSNTFNRPNQLPDFGRQFYIQFGYTM